jgi:hypothetical protein
MRVNPRNMLETMHTRAPPSQWLAYSIARGWYRSRPTITSNLATFSHMKCFRSSNDAMFRPPSMRTSNVTSLTFSRASKHSSSTSALTLESSCCGHRKVMASVQTARLSKGLAFSVRKFSEKRSQNFEFCSPPLLRNPSKFRNSKPADVRGFILCYALAMANGEWRMAMEMKP